MFVEGLSVVFIGHIATMDDSRRGYNERLWVLPHRKACPYSLPVAELQATNACVFMDRKYSNNHGQAVNEDPFLHL